MKLRIIPILIILAIGFSSITIFLSVGLMDHRENYKCPIAAMSGGACPFIQNVLAMTIHHISGFQNLIQGIIGSNLNLLAFSILSLAVSLLAVKLFKEIYSSKEQHIYQKSLSVENLFFPILKFLSWIAFHNKRDPYLLLSGV